MSAVMRYNAAAVCAASYPTQLSPAQEEAMASYRCICRPECLGDHIHFSVMIRGIKQHIFVSAASVNYDARQRLSNDEAAIHVEQNMRRFVDAARAKAGDGVAASITLDEDDRLLPDASQARPRSARGH